MRVRIVNDALAVDAGGAVLVDVRGWGFADKAERMDAKASEWRRAGHEVEDFRPGRRAAAVAA